MADQRTARRRTKEQEIGDLGESQISTRFKKCNWPNGRVEPDLGEDLLIRIYEGGHSTGLTFLAQVKSTDDLGKYTLKNGDISYPVEVKDLLHWEVSTTPVFLFVWDVTREAGHWISVPDAISALDKDNPGWRGQSTRRSKLKVSVHVPAANTTDDQGLVILRLFVLQHCERQLESWYLKDFSIQFPDTPEGEAHRQEYLRSQASGETVEFPGRYVKVSERDARVLGPVNSWPSTVRMGSQPSTEIRPVKLEVREPDGTVHTVPFLEMRAVKMGTEWTTFSNGHNETPFSPERKATPFRFDMVMGQGQDHYHVNLSTEGSCPTAGELRAALPFMNAFLRGGQFRWTLLSNPHQHERQWHDFPASNHGFSPLFQTLIEALCLIEEKKGCAFTVPDWHISQQDADAIQHILGAISTQRVDSSREQVNLQLAKGKHLRQNEERVRAMLDRWRRSGGYCEFGEIVENDSRELLGVQVELGRCVRQAGGWLGRPMDELEHAIAKAKANEAISVPLLDVRVVHKYLPGSDGSAGA